MANMFLPFLEEQPNILYQAMKPQQGSRSFMDYWKSAYPDVWNQYLGKLGGQALGGQDPTLQFSDFMSQYPWLKNWLSMSPQARGGTRQSNYSPGLRWYV